MSDLWSTPDTPAQVLAIQDCDVDSKTSYSVKSPSIHQPSGETTNLVLCSSQSSFKSTAEGNHHTLHKYTNDQVCSHCTSSEEKVPCSEDNFTSPLSASPHNDGVKVSDSIDTTGGNSSYTTDVISTNHDGIYIECMDASSGDAYCTTEHDSSPCKFNRVVTDTVSTCVPTLSGSEGTRSTEKQVITVIDGAVDEISTKSVDINKIYRTDNTNDGVACSVDTFAASNSSTCSCSGCHSSSSCHSSGSDGERFEGKTTALEQIYNSEENSQNIDTKLDKNGTQISSAILLEFPQSNETHYTTDGSTDFVGSYDGADTHVNSDLCENVAPCNATTTDNLPTTITNPSTDFEDDIEFEFEFDDSDKNMEIRTEVKETAPDTPQSQTQELKQALLQVLKNPVQETVVQNRSLYLALTALCSSQEIEQFREDKTFQKLLTSTDDSVANDTVFSCVGKHVQRWRSKLLGCKRDTKSTDETSPQYMSLNDFINRIRSHIDDDGPPQGVLTQDWKTFQSYILDKHYALYTQNLSHLHTSIRGSESNTAATFFKTYNSEQ